MRFLYTLFLCIGLSMAAAVSGAQERVAAANGLTVDTAKGSFKFEVEIADTEPAREKGLMFRKKLPEGTGMLFNFHAERPVTFWMKNTYVPLDMIFIRSNGTVASIGEGNPLSEKLIPSNEPVLAVLEVIAGTAQKIGLKSGDKVHHPIFSD